MLITQKFYSLKEIDAEFIPAIEELIKGSYACFKDWQRHEKRATRHTSFSYFLFFCQKHNTPIGITQVTLTDISSKKRSGLLSFFSAREQGGKKVKWGFDSPYPAIAFYQHEYQALILDKLNKLIHQYEQRTEVIQLCVYLNKNENFKSSWNTSKFKVTQLEEEKKVLHLERA